MRPLLCGHKLELRYSDHCAVQYAKEHSAHSRRLLSGQNEQWLRLPTFANSSDILWAFDDCAKSQFFQYEVMQTPVWRLPRYQYAVKYHHLGQGCRTFLPAPLLLFLGIRNEIYPITSLFLQRFLIYLLKSKVLMDWLKRNYTHLFDRLSTKYPHTVYKKL